MALKMPLRRRKPAEVGEDGLVRMSLIDHLTELRRRVVISTVAIALGAVVGFLLYNRVLAFLQEPYCDLKRKRGLTDGIASTCKFVITDPLEGVTTRFKVSAYLGLTLALPVVLWQVWRFITPGLHPKEKKYAIPFIASSVVLFALGALIAVLTFPQALAFLISVSGDNVETLFGPARYISLYTLIMLAFGVAFEFPVLLVFLQLAGALTPRRLLRSWRGAVVGIFVVAAVITPSQDPYSLLGMALPMTLFYFGAIGVGKLLGK
ncbi:MAG: twin-arginine translocase subunit TatC [Acidimicrobiales bacterium]